MILRVATSWMSCVLTHVRQFFRNPFLETHVLQETRRHGTLLHQVDFFVCCPVFLGVTDGPFRSVVRTARPCWNKVSSSDRSMARFVLSGCLFLGAGARRDVFLAEVSAVGEDPYRNKEAFLHYMESVNVTTIDDPNVVHVPDHSMVSSWELGDADYCSIGEDEDQSLGEDVWGRGTSCSFAKNDGLFSLVGNSVIGNSVAGSLVRHGGGFFNNTGGAIGHGDGFFNGTMVVLSCPWFFPPSYFRPAFYIYSPPFYTAYPSFCTAFWTGLTDYSGVNFGVFPFVGRVGPGVGPGRSYSFSFGELAGEPIYLYPGISWDILDGNGRFLAYWDGDDVRE